ncbi:hypothetical protein ONZ45_g6729 [Pleurotus djamor]|nr:hypothetical protein ONZ45_g6729 [Pleurotus djamor]
MTSRFRFTDSGLGPFDDDDNPMYHKKNLEWYLDVKGLESGGEIWRAHALARLDAVYDNSHHYLLVELNSKFVFRHAMRVYNVERDEFLLIWRVYTPYCVDVEDQVSPVIIVDVCPNDPTSRRPHWFSMPLNRIRSSIQPCIRQIEYIRHLFLITTPVFNARAQADEIDAWCQDVLNACDPEFVKEITGVPSDQVSDAEQVQGSQTAIINSDDADATLVDIDHKDI